MSGSRRPSGLIPEDYVVRAEEGRGDEVAQTLRAADVEIKRHESWWPELIRVRVPGDSEEILQKIRQISGVARVSQNAWRSSQYSFPN